MTSQTKNITENALRAKKPSEKRLAFIDFRLAFAGSLKRPLLVDEFGISAQQATKDIKAYTQLAESNLEYSLARKTYLASKAFKPVFATTTAKTFLKRLSRVARGSKRYKNWVGADVPVKLSRIPTRLTNESVLQAIVTGLRHRRRVEFNYVSINTGKISRRVVMPRALGSDGFRWHVRAWDFNKQRFSDFVLSRISETHLGEEEVQPPPYDEAWHAKCEVVIVPAKHLPKPSRAIVAKEFGMDKELMRVETTKAMLFYTLRGYGFDARNFEDGQLVNRSLFSLQIDNLQEVQELLGKRS